MSYSTLALRARALEAYRANQTITSISKTYQPEFDEIDVIKKWYRHPKSAYDLIS